jgi:hypothetical protein
MRAWKVVGRDYRSVFAGPHPQFEYRVGCVVTAEPPGIFACTDETTARGRELRNLRPHEVRILVLEYDQADALPPTVPGVVTVTRARVVGELGRAEVGR